MVQKINLLGEEWDLGWLGLKQIPNNEETPPPNSLSKISFAHTKKHTIQNYHFLTKQKKIKNITDNSVVLPKSLEQNVSANNSAKVTFCCHFKLCIQYF